MSFGFGFTNTPTFFLSLMNKVFQLYLRKFFLVFFDDISVFFDDISVYSCTPIDHVGHLKLMLTELHKHQLGHVVSTEGVSTNQSKLAAMLEWFLPKTVKEFRAF